MGDKWYKGDGLEDNWYQGDAGEVWGTPLGLSALINSAVENTAQYNWLTENKKLCELISFFEKNANEDPISSAFHYFSKRWGKEEAIRILRNNENKIVKTIIKCAKTERCRILLFKSLARLLFSIIKNIEKIS